MDMCSSFVAQIFYDWWVSCTLRSNPALAAALEYSQTVTVNAMS